MQEFATPNLNARIWKTEKLFLNISFHFGNLHQILNILKQKMILIANVFPKLQTVKNLFRTPSKRCCFRACFDSQHGKASQILAKSPWERFYHVLLSFSRKLIGKMAPLVLREIIRVFFNTLTGGGKYPVQDCQCMPLPFKCNYLKNEKLFLHFLFHFWNLHLILNNLKQKMTVIANVFHKLKTVKILVRPLSETRPFRTRFRI